MARARNIKPGFFTNDLLAECDPLARLLFAGLWTVADRAGRLEDRPKRIKAEVLPYDDCDIEALLDELTFHKFIVRYERNGERYIQVVNFSKHQTPHIREANSQIPGIEDEHQTSTVPQPDEHRESPSDSGFRIPDTGLPVPPTPPPASNGHAPNGAAPAAPTFDFRPSYAATLGPRYAPMQRTLYDMSAEFTDGWLRTALAHAEQRAGPLPLEPLTAGLRAALEAIKRKLDAEKAGGQLVGALSPYAAKIIADRLKEQADARHDAAPAAVDNPPPGRPVAPEPQPERVGIRRHLRGP